MVNVKLSQHFRLAFTAEELKVVSLALRLLSAKAIDPEAYGPPTSEDIERAGALNWAISVKRGDILKKELAVVEGTTRFLADFVKTTATQSETTTQEDF